MLHSGQLRELGFRRRNAAQLLSHPLVRRRVRAQHALEEPFGGRLVAPRLQQEVKFRAMLIDGAPQQVGFTPQAEAPLIEMPRPTGLAARRFDPVGTARAKLVAPAADRL